MSCVSHTNFGEVQYSICDFGAILVKIIGYDMMIAGTLVLVRTHGRKFLYVSVSPSINILSFICKRCAKHSHFQLKLSRI